MDLAIIGVDGLDPILVRKWQDDLPALSSLISEGGFGHVQSSFPPLTSPAWPTMITGKQGGKHGVFGFMKKAPDDPTRWTPINYDDVSAESIWEALDEEGFSVGVVNVPLSYPPSDLDEGFVISGWPIPNKVNPASPSSVLTELEDSLGHAYEVNPFPMGPEYDQLDHPEIRDRIVDGMWHHHEAFTTLIDQHNLDVFFAVYMAMDHAGHHLSWERDELRAAYREQDQALADLLEMLSEDTNVVVVSDHGHGGQSEHSFWSNNWLAQAGFQSRTDSTDRQRRKLFRKIGITRGNAIKLKNIAGLDDPRDLLPQRLFEALKWFIPAGQEEHTGFDPEGIDWDETKAFAPMENSIYLNDDRFRGAVESDSLAAMRKSLAAALEAVEHPSEDREEQLMTAIKTKHELFEGPFVEYGPDIVFVADEMEVNTPVALGNSVFTPERFGEHRPKATLVTAGPAFSRAEHQLTEIDITDVFPLVFGVLDVPVPENIDGEIPEERFVDDVSLQFRPSKDACGESNYTSSEADRVEEQLKGLGYLE